MDNHKLPTQHIEETKLATFLVVTFFLGIVAIGTFILSKKFKLVENNIIIDEKETQIVTEVSESTNVVISEKERVIYPESEFNNLREDDLLEIERLFNSLAF